MNIRLDTIGPRPGDPSTVHIILPPEGAATAEDLAMIQAKYSRDPRSIVETIAEAKEDAAGKFMEKFYVGYGHDSIADCAPVLFAVEGVPLHVAKLIQHFPLYNGQECSTRYLDFSKQPMQSRTPEGGVVQEKMRQFYLEAFEPTQRHLAKRFSLDLADKVEEKAARAATFDVLRGFLPIGVHTSLSWSTTLRQVNEHCTRMLRAVMDRWDVLQEANQVVLKIAELARRHFPQSVKPADQMMKGIRRVHGPIEFTDIEMDYPWTEVKGPGSAGRFFLCEGQIDFGSWRDLARHRSVAQTFPLLRLDSRDLSEWYQEQLPEDLHHPLADLMGAVMSSGDLMCMPLGVNVGYRISGPEEAFRYIAKLRTSSSVHPTLRAEMFEMARQLKLEASDGPREWTVTARRGQQDIARKEAASAQA